MTTQILTPDDLTPFECRLNAKILAEVWPMLRAANKEANAIELDAVYLFEWYDDEGCYITATDRSLAARAWVPVPERFEPDSDAELEDHTWNWQLDPPSRDTDPDVTFAVVDGDGLIERMLKWAAKVLKDPDRATSIPITIVPMSSAQHSQLSLMPELDDMFVSVNFDDREAVSVPLSRYEFTGLDGAFDSGDVGELSGVVGVSERSASFMALAAKTYGSFALRAGNGRVALIQPTFNMLSIELACTLFTPNEPAEEPVPDDMSGSQVVPFGDVIDIDEVYDTTEVFGVDELPSGDAPALPPVA